MPPKGKSKNAAKGKGRGRERPVLRAPSPSAVSDSPEHAGQDTEKDSAAQKTEPDAAEVHDPQDEGLFEARGTEGPGQNNASSPSQSAVSRGILQPNCIFLYLDPDARCRRVIASFLPGSSGALQNVCGLAILGPSRSRISSNISVGIRMKFINDLWSSLRSSIIKIRIRSTSVSAIR